MTNVTYATTTNSEFEPYGLEFSPSKEWIYLGGAGKMGFIKSSDMAAGGSISSKITTIYTGGTTYNMIMGPKGYMYMIQQTQPYLYVIKKPDAPDTTAPLNTVTNLNTFFSSCPGKPQYGLPNFMPSFFLIKNLTGDTNLLFIKIERCLSKDTFLFFIQPHQSCRL